jgi:hypothetical protein
MVIILKEGGIFGDILKRIKRRNDPESLDERMDGIDELEEMAGLRKFRTKLPVNLWVDDSKTYAKGRHAKRIKFQGDRGNNINTSNLFSMIISKDDPQIPASQLPRLKLPAKDIDAVKTFVRNNADLLSSLADAKIDFIAFTQQMKV